MIRATIQFNGFMLRDKWMETNFLKLFDE